MAIDQTLSAMLMSKAHLETVGIRFINGAQEEEFISYGNLYKLSLNTLSLLQEKGIKPNDELVIQIEDNKMLIVVFWACILGGIIPVPVSIGRNDEHKRKLFLIWEILNNPHLICSSELLSSLGEFALHEKLNDALEHLSVNHVDTAWVYETRSNGKIYNSKPADIAFIQFSSGSTGTPKGVVLTHENLIANVSAISAAAQYSKTDSLFSWMPLTHDMGMIGFHINPLFCGINHHIMPTSLFVRKPALWFDKVSEHAATILGCPNFGYSYILKYCGGKSQNWNLGSVRILYNGAEPISTDLCNSFLDQMAVYGLQRKAVCPVYGLAEASLAVSISRLDQEIISHTYLREYLKIGDRVSKTNRKENSIDLVNVGSSIDNCTFKIVDQLYEPVADEVVGHVLIKGRNVTQGYYNNPQATQQATHKGWVDTGDLGFIQDGALYITGRAKDIVFVNGQNYYPHDIERVAEGVPGVELNKIVIGRTYDQEGHEEQIIAFVFYRGDLKKFVSIGNAIKALVNRKMGIEISEVLPVRNIPRTTSGKLQRYKLLQAYQAGQYQDLEKELQQYVAQNNEREKTQLPSNEREKRISDIWSEILTIDHIGVHQSFFDLGGNSLKLAEMAMRLQKTFGVEMSLGTLYEMATIARIAESLEDLNKKQFVAIPKTAPSKDYPLSQSQKRLYYAWTLNEKSTAYNIPVAFEVIGTIDYGRLENAVEIMIAKYTQLRVSFTDFQEPRFVIRENSKFKLKHVASTPENLHETLKLLVEPFNLVLGDLFRIAIITVEDQNAILFIDFHHIILDGLSVQRFTEELLKVYEGKQLDDKKIDYEDYVFWQQEDLLHETMRKQETYWLDTFKDGVPLLQLPTDRPRKNVLTTDGRRLQFQIGHKNSAYLRRLARQQGASLHTLLFSMYKWFLAKLCGQTDIVIGIPTSGRNHLDLQSMLGMFVNNLAIRATTSTNESFLDSLGRDIQILGEGIRNQEYPYAKLVEQLDGNRDVSRNPLFDTMFLFPPVEFQNTTTDFKLKRSFFDPGFSKFDLSMEIVDQKDIGYIFEYASNLFEEDTIVRFAVYFENLLKQLIHEPATLFSETSILPHKEYTMQIEEFNTNESSFGDYGAETVVSLFEKQASTRKQQTALEFDGLQISYAGLNEMADRFRTKLELLGIRKGDTVCVSLPRSPELIASMLGILKLGAVYLPIEDTTPLRRMAHILSDSESKLLVCRSRNAKLGTLDIAKLYTEEDLPIASPALRPYNCKADDLAYIIYTSGTTGTPKGVMIAHGALLNYLNWGQKKYLDGTPATFALFTSIGFDLTLTSIFLPLISGNKLVIYEESNGDELTQVLKDNKTTHLKLTPSHMKMVIANDIRPLGSLETLIVGGEKLTTDVALRFSRSCEKNVAIFNEYGPTEATIGCMIHKYDATSNEISVPIGHPIANSKIYLLDEFLNPVPIGVVGELYIGGQCLAQGYFNNEQLTKEKFIPNPFIDQEFIYKSGDLAKRKPSGEIVYIGRADDQLKIKGNRIEKEEIRTTLIAYKGIQEAVITEKGNTAGELELYAYYIASDNEDRIQEFQLKSYLLERLPHYMVPLYFIEVTQIPINKNGKVNFTALKKIEATPRENNLEELTKLQEVVLRIYKDVLGDEVNTIGANFFEHGGDSIKATQVASKLFQKNVKITPREVLVYNTIEQLTHFISENDKRLSQEDIPDQGTIKGTKALSPIESWWLRQHFHNPDYYTQSILLNLNKELVVEALEITFNTLIAHHDGIRLNFDFEGRHLFFNEKHLAADFKIERFHIQSEQELIPLLEELKGSFDLKDSLLIKAALIQNDGERPGEYGRLFISAHHLLFDGVSWRVFLEDFYNTYQAIIAKGPVVLPQKTASLKRFKEELDLFVETNQMAKERDYWQRIDETRFLIPLDACPDGWEVKNMCSLLGSMDRENTRWLLSKANAHNVDILTLIYVAMVRTLGDWVETNEIKIEMENHGRHLESLDVSRTVGWFTAMFPIVFNLQATLQEDIIEVREKIGEVPHFGLGYGVLNANGTLKSNGYTQTEVRFNYLGQFGDELSNDLYSIQNFATGRESHPNNQMTAKLEINAMVLEGQLQLAFLYNKKAHHEQTIRQLKNSFFEQLTNAIDFMKKEEAYVLTPSDFDTVDITQDELDLLFD